MYYCIAVNNLDVRCYNLCMTVLRAVDTIIWDLDGTLLDTFGFTLDILREVMPKHGFPAPSKEDLAKNYHGTMRDVFSGLVFEATDEQLDALLQDFMALDDEYIQHPDNHVFEDSVRLAKRAHKAGIRQIVVSNRAHGTGRDRKLASPRNIIEASCLAGCIDQVVCGDEVDERKPERGAVDGVLKDGAKVLVIGDQFVDAEFARNLSGRAVLICRDGEPVHLDRLRDGWQDHVDIVKSLDEVTI